MPEDTMLITGADGYIGLRIAQHYLRHSARPLVLWVRAADAEAFERKRHRGTALLGLGDDDAGSDRITWSWGDLTEADPFRLVDRRAVSDIVHSAAVTRFTVDATTARRVNTEGVDKLLRFAASCPSLRAVGTLSTLYASGLRSGLHDESTCGDDAGFANHYEHSKWRAEQLALTAYTDLPVRVLRLATVIADADDGTVTQYNAFHNTLKLFFYGLLSLLPGTPGTPLYFVTGDFAARAVAAVMNRDDAHGVYHVTPSRAESLLLGQLVDLAFGQFALAPEFGRKHILRPLYADSDSFEVLVGALSSFGGNVVNQAMSSVAPFARQLFVHKDIRNDRLRAVMPDYEAPDAGRLITRTCQYLVTTRWGRIDSA